MKNTVPADALATSSAIAVMELGCFSQCTLSSGQGFAGSGAATAGRHICEMKACPHCNASPAISMIDCCLGGASAAAFTCASISSWVSRMPAARAARLPLTYVSADPLEICP
ncbi:hypothetical protein [Paraburkholderia xenovorans]|uniref:hypothetical protein n=1 Tax=Paraburkholderia xenovorans TaxID=36873 RepID=UPI00192AB944|nr:hypothetical protein [Paraburkholderia xenovorans]